MKTSLLLIHFLLIGVFLFITSCEAVESDSVIREKDPERLERAKQEKRRREDNLRRADFDEEYYDEYGVEDEDEDYDEYDYYSSNSNDDLDFDISSDEQDINSKWQQSSYQNYEGYFEYGYANQTIEGTIFIEYVGQAADFPELSFNEKATEIEEAFHDYFPKHPATGLTRGKVIDGVYHDVVLYKTRTEDSKYVDVEAIYSIEDEGDVFIIVVENGGQVSQDFLNNYEDFMESIYVYNYN